MYDGVMTLKAKTGLPIELPSLDLLDNHFLETRHILLSHPYITHCTDFEANPLITDFWMASLWKYEAVSNHS